MIHASSLIRYKQVIGFFSRRDYLENAIKELRQAGFSIGQLSLVTQGIARDGTFASLEIFDYLDNKLLHFPTHRINFLQNRVKQGDYLLIVRGTPTEIRRATNLLSCCGLQEMSIDSISK
ncbi:hypothetical protein F7734_01550 [Scytonema sp. UIC 10036]|uniref:hypothetical protein n=1 Tax=Scytonema sp. UIC 10036 TaxID=2304196 RepID=UPI0012DA5511|nr:hypothetical protein [Scytonema sp. UIC 10036]MUG91247.1 hypothetical protein [Scytonema sp. UIC 10036]